MTHGQLFLNEEGRIEERSGTLGCLGMPSASLGSDFYILNSAF